MPLFVRRFDTFSQSDYVRSDETLFREGKRRDKATKRRMRHKQDVTKGWKRAKSHSASWILAAIYTIHMLVCVRTCGMVPRCVIECFIHKRRTKPACLS